MSDGTTTAVAPAAAEALAHAAFSLARRFADGATMWCVAPRWPAHGRHVAVEFVHPVIVGKRSLPALDVDGTEAVESLRQLARPGDVVLTVGASDDPVTEDLLARSEAWGLTRIRIGAGPPPSDAAAEHTVWLEHAEAAQAACSGELIVLYHLLWELTHVVFEHPGLLGPDQCDGEVCVTCSDEGRVAEVTAIRSDCVKVLVGGLAETIDASLIEPVAIGDLVLVHAGVALTTLRSGMAGEGAVV